MFAIIFCVLWVAAILWWSDLLDVPMLAGVLTWISHTREKISPLVGISEFDQTISGGKP